MNVQKRLIGLLCAGLALLFPWSSGASASDIQDLAWRDGVPYYRQIQGNITHGGPKLIFSDSPEMVGKIGIMYRDTVSGPVRLFFHHVNDTQTDKRLAVLLRRTTIRPTAVSFGKNGISRPNEDWLAAGKEAQTKYYSSAPNGRKLVLDGPRDILNNGKGYILHPQELVTGIVDLNFDKPVEVSFIMMPTDADPRISAEVYPILPPDEGDHVLRGTFEGADVTVTLPGAFPADSGEIWGVKLADDVEDPYVRGIDVTRNEPVVNYGNYGVMYAVNFQTKGSRATQLRFNPYGGAYAGEGVLSLEGDTAKYIRIPDDRQSFGWNGDGETMKLGVVPAGKSGTFFFSPPGSSNLPVRIFWEGIRSERKAKPASEAKSSSNESSWRVRRRLKQETAQKAETTKKAAVKKTAETVKPQKSTMENLLDRIDRTMTINEAN
ncbi:copper amine oxidase [Acidaminococcus timonensis]|uniref:copper amine oxidase n=1 Tax=Acidaminococcus timonensis TaxID=1871002 RepID=UPI0026EC81D1|nr:copper amine oxidase [Acidaminococcus timonensis]